MKEILKRLLARFGLYLTRGYTVYFFSNKRTVRRALYGKQVRMPRSHSITYNLSHFPFYNLNLQRLATAYELYRHDDFSIIDVGANIGDTLLMLRQVTGRPVHCFEGDPFYFRLLEENAAGVSRCQLHPVLLSDKPATVRVRNRSGLGTSEYARDDQGDLMEFTSIDTFFTARFPDERIGILKSDTDGFDLRIVRGAAEMLRKHQPLLFLEYDRGLFEKNGDDGLAFLDFLAELGYDGILFYDNFGKLVCTTNLREKATIRALHNYIKDQRDGFPFYDLAIVPARDQAFFDQFSAAELEFFRC